MARYLFTVHLIGEGDTEGEAWTDAVDAFCEDAGEPAEVREDYGEGPGATSIIRVDGGPGATSIIRVDGWEIEVTEDTDYVFVSRDGKPGSVHVKSEEAGYAVGTYPEDSSEPDATLYSSYEDLDYEE